MLMLLSLTLSTAFVAGPFGHGPGRRLGARMAMNAPFSLIYSQLTASGKVEDISIDIDSESSWERFVGSSGACLYVVRDEVDPKTGCVTTVKIKQLVSSAAALQAAQEAKTTGTYLWVERA